MKTVQLVLKSGRAVNFELETDLHGATGFALSVRKSGSTMFRMICETLAAFNNRRFINVTRPFFYANVREEEFSHDPALLRLIYRGNVYGGFRSMPSVLCGSEIFTHGPKLLLVRDPRDAVVSQYFSDAYSHPIPNATADGDDVKKVLEQQRLMALTNDIDEYVKRIARPFRRTLMEYKPVLHDGVTEVLKYEDYVFDKPGLMRRIVDKFGWRLDAAMIESVLKWADVRPQVEDPTAFIRKVTPGDHREKLKPRTVDALNDIFRPAMKLFGYN